MPYITGDQGNKYPRNKVLGKLIGVSCNTEAVKDDVKGVYGWLRLSLVVGVNAATGEPEYFNASAYKVNYEEMPELKKADELVKNKSFPEVEFEYYTTEKDAVENGQAVMEEFEEQRGGKTVIVQRQKKYKNHRLSADDVKRTFKILAEMVPVGKYPEPKRVEDAVKVAKPVIGSKAEAENELAEMGMLGPEEEVVGAPAK